MTHSAKSVDFRADGLLLVSAGQDAVCWDVALGREVARLPAGPNVTAAFRPVGDGLITFGQETGLLRWPTGAAPGRVVRRPPVRAAPHPQTPGGDGA